MKPTRLLVAVVNVAAHIADRLLSSADRAVMAWVEQTAGEDEQ